MATGSLRRFDVQANYSMILSLVAVPPLLGGAFLLLRNYKSELGAIMYRADTKFQLVFLACVAVSLLVGAVGFVLGLSSAGQRRNEQSGRSWMGFFIGGLVCSFDIVLLIAFMRLKFALSPSAG